MILPLQKRSLLHLCIVTAILLAFALATSYLFLHISHTTYAAQKEDWKAGNIISDEIFTDTNSMTVDDIQAFLDQKIGSCDIWGTGKASEYGSNQTRAQYAAARGWQGPPYTCLNRYYEVPKISPSGTIPNNNYSSPDTIPTGAQSAAWIIKDAAVRYNISPRALLVKIATESIGPLTSDNWPLFSQYRYAMGSHCPDSGPNGSANCDSNYAGFSIQIYSAAQLMRWYLDSMDQPWWSYKKPYQTNSIMWNVAERGCGAGDVYIENKATAALYTYTPYQPNQAALNNLYGSGDNCSAYGNRNFWRVFVDWFGSTTGPSYKSEFYAQSNSSIELFPGQSQYVWVKFKNTGSNSWGDDISAPSSNPIHLATDGPINRSSQFSAQWPTSNRSNLTFERVYTSDGTTPASNQHIVQPGQIAEFKIPISVSANTSAGTYNELFSPIREGASNWWLGPTFSVSVTVKPSYSASHYAQSAYTTLQENDAKTVFFSYKNTGNVPWYDDTSVPAALKPVHLATTNPINSSNNLGESWPQRNRPALTFAAVYESDGVTLASNQHIVQPGQIGKFEFQISNMMNTNTGSNVLAVQPIVEGADKWDMGASSWILIDTPTSSPSASYFSQSTWPTLNRGDQTTVKFMFTNTGQSSWRDDTSNIKGVMPIHLATSGQINRSSIFASNWTNNNRPALTFAAVYESDGVTLASNQHIVQPGQIGKFEFQIRVPINATPGEYIERFQPIAEGAPGIRWNMGGEVFIKVIVR